MTPKEYKKKIENELISEFVKKFTLKIGYCPIVITEDGSNVTNYKVLSLQELEECFEPYLPTDNKNKLQLKPKGRTREILELRHIFCFVARLMRHSYTKIGRYLGRDHTTIINSIKTFRNLSQTDDRFRMKYLEIVNHIKQQHESSALEDFDKI